MDAPFELPLINLELGNVHSKWVNAENYHLTVIFIGETELEHIDKISMALHQIVAHIPSFSFKIKGIGKFQNRRSSGVLWLGVEDNAVLKTLHNEVSNALLKLLPNLKNLYKDYTPHITVARIKDREELSSFKLLLDKLNLNVLQKVNEILLYESVSNAHGVDYSVLERFALNKKGRSKKNRP